MRRIAALAVVSLLGACATPAPSGPDVPTPSADSNDCAVIEVGIMHGPLAGQGSECRMRSGFAGWTVDQCRASWVS